MTVSPPSHARALGRLLAFARREHARIALAAGLQVLTVGSGLGLMGTAAWLLSAAALQPSIAALQVAIVGVRAFGISRAVLRYGERLIAHDVTLRLLARLRSTLFRALVPLAPAALVSRRTGDVLSGAIADVETLDGFFARLLGPSLAAVGVAALLVAVLAPFGWVFPLVAVAGLACGGLLGPGLAAGLAAVAGHRLVNARAELAAGLVDGVRGSAELLAFGGESAHVARLIELDATVVHAQRRLASASALGSALAALAGDLTAIAVLVLAIPALRGGQLAGAELATLTLITVASFEIVGALPQAWQSLGSLGGAAARLQHLMDTEPSVPEPSPALVADRPAAVPRAPAGTPAPLLELRGLRFRYPGEPRPALDGVDLVLDTGARVAIVGPSGSGKSTLLRLLLRYWEAPAETIFLDGRDVRRLPSDAVRSRIAFAGQRAHVFTGTLRENLLLARPHPSTQAVDAVLRALQLDALVALLPDGLDSWIGEEGQQLSGGERQRLALARALLHQAPLLLLDEPTAQLDAVTALAATRAIRQAGRGRATLVVSHSLVGLEDFDEVLLLDSGRVMERGTAAELATRSGAFSRLLALQRGARAIERVASDARA